MATFDQFMQSAALPPLPLPVAITARAGKQNASPSSVVKLPATGRTTTGSTQQPSPHPPTSGAPRIGSKAMTPKASKNSLKGFPALTSTNGNLSSSPKNWTTLGEYVSQITSDEALASQLDFRTGDLILTQDTLKKIAKRRRKLLKAKFEGLPEAVASPLICHEYDKREHILRKEVTSFQDLLNEMEQAIARQLREELLHEIAMNLQQVQSDERISREDILAEQELELVTTEADFFTTAPTLVLQANANNEDPPSMGQSMLSTSIPSSRQSRKQSTPRTGGQPRQPTPSFAPTPPLESNLSTSRRTSGRESNSSRSTARRASRKEEQKQERRKQDEEETEKRVFDEN